MPADATVATPAENPNPANARGNVLLPGPSAGTVAAQRARAGRAETLALLEAGKTDGAKPSVQSGRAAPEVDPDQQPGGRRPHPPTAEPTETDDDEADAEGDAKPDPKTEAKPDPETSRRLGQIQAAEKRHREKIATDNAKIDARLKSLETEWAPKIKAANDFEALMAKAARARANPAFLGDLLKSVGYSEDHFEGAGQALYALSKAGQADPTRAKQAAALLRDRDDAERVDATQRRLDELEAKFSAREQQAELRQLWTGYLDTVVESVTDDAPIAKAAMAKIDKARALGTPEGKAEAKKLYGKLYGKLREITEEMTKELDGDVPEHADVVARYEQLRGAELDELDIPRPTKSDKKQNSQPADKQNPAKTLSADLGAPRVPRPSSSGKEHRNETRRMLESGKFE